MNGGYMGRRDAIAGVIVIVLITLLCVILYRCEENKYKECKYLIIDSHKYQYHAISYEILDKNCVNMVDENNRNVIICGQYTIEEIK